MATVRRERPDASLSAALSAISQDVLGAPLPYSDEEIAGILSPRHFVDVRRTHGGPAPAETMRALGEARQQLDDDCDWLTRTRQALAAAETGLHARCAAL